MKREIKIISENQFKCNRCDKIIPVERCCAGMVIGVVSCENCDNKKETINNLIGVMVREKRKENQLTQKELGKKVGFSTQHIGLIETGHDRPSITIIYKIAKALKCEITELLPSIGHINNKHLTPQP